MGRVGPLLVKLGSRGVGSAAHAIISYQSLPSSSEESMKETNIVVPGLGRLNQEVSLGLHSKILSQKEKRKMERLKM